MQPLREVLQSARPIHGRLITANLQLVHIIYQRLRHELTASALQGARLLTSGRREMSTSLTVAHRPALAVCRYKSLTFY